MAPPRLVYAELHGAENAANVSITLRLRGVDARAGAAARSRDERQRQVLHRHTFAATLAELEARHIRIPPYTPRWNGKIERFFGTLEDEWAHGRAWPDSTTRDRALSSFMRYFNRWRPHSGAVPGSGGKVGRA